MEENTQNKIWFLHALRGIASVIVLLWHYMGFWYTNASIISAFPYLTPVTNNSYLVFFNIMDSLQHVGIDLGAFGVALFFLISGFVIPITLEKNKNIKFLISRFFRIYPPYVIGFGITILVLLLYTIFQNISFPFGIQQVITQTLLIRDWFWFPSIDGVSWTLETELKFYIVAFVIAKISSLNKAKTLLLVSFLFCLTNILLHNHYGFFMNKSIQLYGIIYVITYSSISITFMFIGTCFYNFHKKYWSFNKFISTALLILAFFIMTLINSPMVGYVKVNSFNYILALVFFTCVYLVKDEFSHNKVLSFLANISYPLYIVHGLNGYIIMTVMGSLNINPYICLIIAIVSSFILAYLLHKFVENPSRLLAKKLTNKITTRVE